MLVNRQKEASMGARWTTMILALVTACVMAAMSAMVSGQSPAAGNPLIGAWKVTEIADANATPITAPQPGLYVFTKEHYSFARINGTKPLPDYPSNDKATDADKV